MLEYRKIIYFANELVILEMYLFLFLYIDTLMCICKYLLCFEVGHRVYFYIMRHFTSLEVLKQRK